MFFPAPLVAEERKLPGATSSTSSEDHHEFSRESTSDLASLIMTMQHLDTSPKTDDFTPLQEHQEQTPTTFFGAKPILYAHYPGLTLSASASQLGQDAAFSKFVSESDGEDALVKDVEIWVNSE